MISKKELLKNLQAYTPEQIAEEVRSGNVTLYELAKGSEGAFTPLLKKQVKEILNKPTEHPHLISEQRAPEQLEDSSYPKEQNLEISLPGSIQAEEMEQADGKQVEQHQFFSKIQEETQTINNLITFTKSISGEVKLPLVVGNNNSILTLIKLQNESEYETIVSVLKALL